MTSEEVDSESLLTLAEAAAALGITPLRLRQLAERGVAHPVDARVGPRAWWFNRAEVERVRPDIAWLARGRERRGATPRRPKPLPASTLPPLRSLWE